MRNMIKAASIFAAITIGFTIPVSCEKPAPQGPQKEYVLTSHREEFVFSYRQGSLRSTLATNATSLKVQSNYSWFEGEITETSSDGFVLEITVEENTTGSQRKGAIDLIAMDETGAEVKRVSIPVIQNTNSGTVDGKLIFEDEVFEQLMLEKCDRDADDAISEEEALAITELELENLGINSISGIEYFKNLTTLDLKDNNIQRIDISGLDKLTYIEFTSNKVTSFKCDGCTSLKTIYGSLNKLKKADLQPAKESLVLIDFAFNELGELNLSGMKKLQYAALSNNKLQTLTVDGCPELWNLTCSKNQLTELNLAGLSSLLTVECDNNFLKSLSVNDSPKLGHLFLQGNTRINTLDISKCEMIHLDISETGISELNLSQNPLIETLRLNKTKVTTLNLSGLKGLKQLECSDLELTGLDVTANTLLETLKCANSGLSTIDLSGKAALKTVWLGKNSIKELDLGDSDKLEEVKVKDNQMTSLVLAKALENSTSLKLEKDSDCVVTYR